jgi:ferredoxin-like protein FixX
MRNCVVCGVDLEREGFPLAHQDDEGRVCLFVCVRCGYEYHSDDATAVDNETCMAICGTCNGDEGVYS